jgi:methylmalonyl-CoA mutase
LSKRSFNLDEFESVGLNTWQTKVAEDLDRAKLSHAKLVRVTKDGILPKPIFSAENTKINQSFSNPPGFSPYVRGFKILRDKNLQIQQRLNRLDREDLELTIHRSEAHGVKSFILNYDESSLYSLGALTPADLSLYDVLEEEIHLLFDFGEYYFPLLAKLEAFEFKNRQHLSLRVDPIGNFLEYSKSMFSMKEHVYFIQQIFNSNHGLKIDRVFNFSSQVVLNAGANNVQEIAYLLSNAYFWIKKIGLKQAREVIGYMHFTLGVDSELFHNIAKIKAFRLVWSRLMDILDYSEETNKIGISTRFNENWISSLDPWMNMLRNTTGAFSSVCADVDGYMPFSYDDKIRYTQAETEKTKAWSDRIAQNTVHLINKESHIGQVLDPAGGSWAVDSMTHEIANAAWKLFQTINEEEDFFKFIKDKKLHDLIAPNREAAYEQIKKRKVAISGVNQYPNKLDSLIGKTPELVAVESYSIDTEATIYIELVKNIRDGEFELKDVIDLLRNGARVGHIINIFKAHSDSEKIDPLERHSLVGIFEELRLRVQKLKLSDYKLPTCHLICVGHLSQLSTRATFCKDYFELLELEVVEHYSLEFEVPTDLEADALVVLVSVDEDYADIFAHEKFKEIHHVSKFIAGQFDDSYAKEVEAKNIKRIFSGQDVFAVLDTIVKSWEAK